MLGAGALRQFLGDLIDASDSIDDPDIVANSHFSVFAEIIAVPASLAFSVPSE